MTKAEIEFLRAAGFTLEEIMAMRPPEPQPAPTAPAPAQSTPEPQPAPTAPASPAPAQPIDNNPELTKLLTQILGAIQAGNRSAAVQPTPERKSPEEIAGQLY